MALSGNITRHDASDFRILRLIKFVWTLTQLQVVE